MGSLGQDTDLALGPTQDNKHNKHNKGSFYEEDYDEDYDYDDNNYIESTYGTKREYASSSKKKDSSSYNNAWNNFSPNQWEVVTGRTYYQKH